MNPNASLTKGVVCGVRELAKGKALDKILRT